MTRIVSKHQYDQKCNWIIQTGKAQALNTRLYY
jgi:hypothetical protein